jgi:(2Fe-2S) ferredoxin
MSSEENRSKRFFVCVNRRFSDEKPSCAQRGSVELISRIEEGCVERSIDVVIERKVCLNLCMEGPAMRIVPGGRIFRQVSDSDIPEILDELEKEFGRKTADDAGMFWPGA